MIHSFIDVLVDMAEKPAADGRSLADRLRRSLDEELGNYDGTLVNELMILIDAVVAKTPAQEVRAAFNAIAGWCDVDLLEDDEELGGPYSDMFVGVVLDAINERPA
jgi:hypothetical protein